MSVRTCEMLVLGVVLYISLAINAFILQLICLFLFLSIANHPKSLSRVEQPTNQPNKQTKSLSLVKI